MISPALKRDIRDLIRMSHRPWILCVCSALEQVSESMDISSLIANLPVTHNKNAAHCLESVIRQAEGLLSWRALGASLELCTAMYSEWMREERLELLWSGPSPANQIPARRIDQVFYDLIDSSRREILLVTFAAHKILRLTDGLARAIQRGVLVRLVLEFEESSQGQLSLDAINAFPEIIRQRSQIFYWPLEKRGLNGLGRPGKLHAKAALIDDHAVLTSANLTDDAFTRNLELGILVSSEELLQRIRWYFDSLSRDGILKLWSG